MTAADTIRELEVAVKRCPECGTGFGADAAFCPFDGIALERGTWDPTRDPLTGTVVDRRYEVVEPLGEGGMGTVYRVRHVMLDRMFAMKVLRRELAADGELAARFLREAKATAAVRHPSVVAITDFGALDDGAPYFVMELLVGETLAARLRARGPLPPREAAEVARRLAEALAVAHGAGVVHRDLKPENVFLVAGAAGEGAADDLRVVDFGASKIIGGSNLTRPGVVFGTPYYMAPEQASGQAVDARADVYSLGVLLYEMLTGALPFEADTYMGVLTKHMFVEPTRPSVRLPDLACGELEDVVMRALAKEPRARQQSMTELAEALARAVDARAVMPARAASRPGRAVAFSQMSTADRIQLSVTRRVEEEHRRKRRRVVVALTVSAAAAVLVVSALAAGLRARPLAPSSPPVATSGPSSPVARQAAATSPALGEAPPDSPESTSRAEGASSPGAAASSPESWAEPASPGPAASSPALAAGASPSRPKAAASGPVRARPAPAAPTPGARPFDDLSDPWRR
jgi:eukaryotic-like serine/threonine-protein kinase